MAMRGSCRRPFGRRHRRRGRILVSNGAGFGILDEKIDLVVLRAPIDRSDNDAGELAGPMNGGGLPIVLQHSDEMIARLEPHIVESGDEGGNLSVPFSIAQPLRTIDDRERNGVARHAGNKARAEIKHVH